MTFPSYLIFHFILSSFLSSCHKLDFVRAFKFHLVAQNVYTYFTRFCCFILFCLAELKLLKE